MKKLNLTKKTAIALYSMLAIVLSSCEQQPTQSSKDLKLEIKYTSLACDIKVVEIDSCQYIIAQTGSSNGGVSIIHKSNCKNSHHNCK